MEASSHNSISNFASKLIAALDIMQQFVATVSMQLTIPCCVAIMVMVPSSDLICWRIFGGAIQTGGSDIHLFEQDLVQNCNRISCICLTLSDDHCVEDTVFKLFGLCHRRCMTTPPLLILRFNSKDVLSLCSVKAIRYLQLSSIPRLHILDRLSGGSPAGHQMDWTFIEALEDYRCGNFGSELSTDGRMPYGSICSLLCLLHEFRSSSFCSVRLGTYLSCSTTESLIMMYNDPLC